MAATTTVQKNDTHSSHHKPQYSSLHNRVLEDAYCYIDCFRALPGPKNYLPAATSPRCDESLQVFQTAGDAFQEKPSESCNDLYT
ncbi:hypothetical protein DPMN_105244 [Dreissena polymorpha]|uniref:Uncharacterized protein n=1 Tax=Dreissena polymorpha TaxID=45954 RepID=A0A9D4HBG8_DREPO|nr:hypothetical protein DPMN_105244 [Dreissena polymorpha]